MKALVLTDINRFEYIDYPEPEIGDEDVLIRVKACGICGSDVHGMDGSTGRRIPPVIMGHEASGVIEHVGKKVDHFKVNDRVTFDSTIYPLDDGYTKKGYYNLSDNRKVLGVSCDEYTRQGALAEYVAVPQHILYHIPDNVSFNQAAMVEPIAVAAHAVALTPLSLQDTAVVVGTGMIGLFLVQSLRAAGCGTIIAVDTAQEKRTLALELGADHAFNPDTDDIAQQVFRLTSDRGADVAFEAVGISDTLKTAIAGVRKGGTVTCVGNLSPSVDFPLQSVVTRQIRVQGSCAICGEYPIVLDMLKRGTIQVERLVSKTAPLSEGAKWFQRLYKGEKGLVKVILNP